MMKQQFLIPTLFLLVGLLSSFDEKSVPDVTDYINTYKQIAIDEMHRSGIPASITLAQGLHESGIGKGQLALSSNNHFGIKCKKDWKGESFYWKDDDRDAQGNLIESCFRVYSDVRQSYSDHSDFLVNNKRYHPLFQLDRTDYVAWAKGLKSCGYATDKKYADKLIRTIERYGLYKFDIIEEPAIVEVIEEDDEALDNDEAYDDEISDEAIVTYANVPAAEPIPEDYQRHMYQLEEVEAPSVEATVVVATSAISETPTNTISSNHIVQEQPALPKEEATSPMLIPETYDKEKPVEKVQTSMAPSYNIAAFSNTEQSSTNATSQGAKHTDSTKRITRSKDHLIQMQRKPRISKSKRK